MSRSTYIAIVAASSILLISTAYIGINASRDTTNPADAIVILGKSATVNGKINPCLKARVEHGVDLYKQGLAPVIIMTGGGDTESIYNESRVMGEEAVKEGVPVPDLILEDKATSTYENIINTKEILDARQARKILLVTEQYHSPRATLVAKKNLSQIVYVSPSKKSDCEKNLGFLVPATIREVFALIFYFATGKI